MKDTCLTCHKEAAAQHKDWLPNAKRLGYYFFFFAAFAGFFAAAFAGFFAFLAMAM